MLSIVFLGLISAASCRPIFRHDVYTKNLVKRDSISGPKINGANFPDPGLIFVDKWYAFATRTIGSSIHIQVATSLDFDEWSLHHNSDGTGYNALQDLPAWAVQDVPNTWAPDVNQLDDGSFVMYFSASTIEDTTKHCVGAAVSDNVLGPYTPTSDEPLFCPLSEGGAIDAAGYNDNGQRYIVYKVDGNSLGHGGACNNQVEPIVPTPLKLQPVASDGYTLQGDATILLDHVGATDDGILEAPVVVKKDGIYFLLFSSGCFTTTNYDVDYATADSITGPYTRAASPLISTGQDGLQGPGGADVSKDLKYLLFHANYGNGRGLFTAMVTIDGQTLTV
ncbi:putative glycoside hydrolase, family 43 [Septoria linicola]|nr:putative glycoside hydrolase, family 43 [Septoria linicola]